MILDLRVIDEKIALQVIRADPESIAPTRRAAEDLLARVAPYAEACDWTQAVTTFFGAHPSEPSLALRTGIPTDAPVEFIAGPP